METSVLRPPPRYRLFHPEDLPQLEELFNSFKPRIAGLRSPRLYRALGRDAVSNRDIIIIVAEEGSSLIGFNITVVGRRRFIRNFILKHPLLSLRIAVAKALQPRRTPDAERPAVPFPPGEDRSFPSPGIFARSWKDSSSEIAKILWTGVRESHRRRRVSSGIGAHLLRVLEDRGVKRVDVLVEPRNRPSVRLTRGLGFRTERRGEWLFGTLDFGTRTGHDPEKT